MISPSDAKTFAPVPRRPRDNPLVQQHMKAFRPVHSFKSALILLTSAFIALFAIGLALCLEATGRGYAAAKEHSVRYDRKCAVTAGQTETCTIEFSLVEDMEGPVLVYYRLVDFYQNHRMFIKSRSYQQLAGKPGADTSKCSPVDESEDLDVHLPMLNGAVVNPDSPLNPCGIAAKSYFNGVY